MSSSTMIDARGISKSYQRGVPVLDDVTLSLRRGEMVALIGASGSGKSTLIRAIAGLTPIDGSRDGAAGTIEMMGEPIQRDGRLNTGRALRAIHDSEVASKVLGIDVARYKLLAFVLSAIYAALAGAYLALFDGLVTPATAGFLRSIEFVTMAVLGGLGSIVGSIVGAAILVVLPQVLTVFHDYEHIVLGLIMIVVMVFMRAGVVPSLATLLRRRA